MTADELRRLAVLIERTDHDAIDRAAAYLRACADALERGPVGWISPSNPRKDGSDPRQLVQDYEASGGYGFSADTALSRGWAALYPLAMPAPLRLPEPLTDEEVDALIDETEYLPTDRAVRYLVSEGERRVKEANK